MRRNPNHAQAALSDHSRRRTEEDGKEEIVKSYIECPCCGDDGAESDIEGYFYDGQLLTCGCRGWLSVDEDGDVWANLVDEPCEKCGEA